VATRFHSEPKSIENFQQLELFTGIQDLRKEIVEVIEMAKGVIPKRLVCLEWSHKEYYASLECSSVDEIKYHAGDPFQTTNGPFETQLHVDAERLGDLKPGVYELIICTNVFEHLSHPEASFRSVVKAAAPGGWILITAPFFEINHGAPWDFHRYSYHAWYVYAKDNDLCIHKIGGVHEIVPERIYLLSYIIAQKQPCHQPSEVLDTPTLVSLVKESGYVL
jgi:SAM-dependent methyltransferase